MYTTTKKRFRDVKTNKKKIFLYSTTKKRNGTYQDYKCVILSTTNKINMHREAHKKKIPTYWAQQKKETDLSRPTKKRHSRAVQQKKDTYILSTTKERIRSINTKNMYNTKKDTSILSTTKKQNRTYQDLQKKTFLYSTTKKRYPHIKYNKRKNQTYQGYKML